MPSQLLQTRRALRTAPVAAMAIPSTVASLIYAAHRRAACAASCICCFIASMLAQARLGMLGAGTEKHMCDALRHWGLGLGDDPLHAPEFCSAEQHRHAPKHCCSFHKSSDPFYTDGPTAASADRALKKGTSYPSLQLLQMLLLYLYLAVECAYM
ncbi:uncharacterized protein TrAtP1_008550 [Trichoderma atroviride]|uniref:uncharacterized protein n=1 Tax=Hypocrea atroviridis TaxID=63577 RepID=UPI003320028D|nr:hypothetical protein TrAtP1_008550 [Trichoderma atroviride]